KHSLTVYSGLVPMSPNTTPSAVSVSAAKRLRPGEWIVASADISCKTSFLRRPLGGGPAARGVLPPRALGSTAISASHAPIKVGLSGHLPVVAARVAGEHSGCPSGRSG